MLAKVYPVAGNLTRISLDWSPLAGSVAGEMRRRVPRLQGIPTATGATGSRIEFSCDWVHSAAALDFPKPAPMQIAGGILLQI